MRMRTEWAITEAQLIAHDADHIARGESVQAAGAIALARRRNRDRLAIVKLVILAVGKLKDAWALAGCAEYEKRLRHYATTSVVEVRDAEALAGKVPERHRLIALDERGDEPTSEGLAEKLRRWQATGLPGVCLVIGGADGLPRALVEKADERLSLSRLTLPHRLARLVLLEQLYRAFTIVRGEPYHRA